MKITVLTPIHIGDGETLKPLSYVMDKTSLYVLNMDNFFSILSHQQRKTYLRWIEPILDRIADINKQLEKVKSNFELKKQLKDQLNYEEGKLKIAWFIENRLDHKKAIDFVKKCTAYQVSCLSPVGRYGFKTFIKSIQNEAYIPGTEIKGAIRTSILYSLLRNEDNYEILRKSLSDFSIFFRRGISPKHKVERLSNIANAQSEVGLERKLLRGKEKDAKYDLFKFFTISDTNAVLPAKLQISTIKVLGTKRNIKLFAETVTPKTEFNFDFKVDEKSSLAILGLEKLKDCLSEANIFEACYQRSKEILEEEERYFAKDKRILDDIYRLKKENQSKSPLLRLGFGQGFLGTTVNLKVKLNDSKLFDEAVREGVSFLRRWKTQPGKFPKTRRVLLDARGNPKLLLGFVKLSKD